MPAYRYRAVHLAGQVTQGIAAASNEGELSRMLLGAGLELIDAREKKPALRLRLHGGVTPRTLALFCQQMNDMLQAGIPFVDALRDVAEGSEAPALAAALADVTRLVNHGSKISDAFARNPRLFPAVFTAIIAAGERGGDLAGTFSRLARYAEDRARLAERLQKALRYPVFLLVVTLAVTVFMMALVVPQIVSFLSSINSALPLSTRILIGCSAAFTQYWWALGLLMLVMTAAAAVARRLSSTAARRIDALLLRLPLLGAVWRKMILARFMYSFAALVKGGVTIVDSLRGAQATLHNKALEAQVEAADRQIAAGQALSSALQGLLPAMALRMLRIGEQSGRLDKSLGDVAASFDREASDAAERLIGALEPALTLVVGGLLAWVVLAVLGPIYGSLATLNMIGS